MGDFAKNYTKKQFMDSVHDNGWVLNPDDKFFFEELL